MNKQQTAITKLISTFKESIDYLESSLEDVTDETTRIRLRARLSQARYFLNYANEAKAMEKEQHSETFNQGVQWMQYHRDLVNGGAEYWDKEPSHFGEYYKETYGE